ncbi:MAG: serine/threonine protein kinase, partial [Acidaminococcaceae bacterium]|nr:serine/threonine protein kinase [Acidaminococcaceae bacterium]
MQLKTGTTLQNGKYRITRILGQGGFGITYEAEQSGLNRMVALKEFFMKDCCERHPDSTLVFVPTKNNRELVEKFRGKFIREAQMIAAFDHPYIVRVLEVFEENGTAYYVMNRVPGGSLKDRVLASGPLPETEALGYIRQVADALAYVHARNTVHLDIKPSNILLNDRNEVILIDFGISKHYDSSGEQTSSTPIGLSKGFSPLEQRLDGDVRQFGPSTDIYALGATLYYLVSGLEPPEASLAAENGVPRPEGVSDL